MAAVPAAGPQLDDILESMEEQFLALDREWRITYMNRRAERAMGALGRPRSDVMGRSFWELFPELTGTRFHAAAQRVLADGVTIDFEELYAPAGRWFAGRIAPAQHGVIAYSRDVTVRKRAEAAARESYELLQAIIEGANESIFVKDLDGRYLLVNGAAARELRLPADEIVGRDDFALHPAETAQLMRDHDRRVLEDPAASDFEESIAWPDGARTFHVTKTVLRDGQQRATGVLGIARDVTRWKQAEQALRASEERQRFIAEASAVLSASLDYEVTLDGVARLAVGRLADLCVIDLVDDGGIRRVAAAHRDPSQIALVDELRRFAPTTRQAPSAAARVLREGRTVVTTEITDDRLAEMALDGEHLRVNRALRPRSSIVVPLIARGRTFGALSLVATGEPRQYAPDDIALAEELAVRAALAVDNARLFHEAQVEIAERRRAAEEIRRLNRDLERRVGEFQTLLDVIPIGICIALDPDCRGMQINPAFAEMLGVRTELPSDAAAGDAAQSIRFSRDGEELPAAELPLQRAARDGIVVRDAELELLSADGRRANLVGYAAPLFDEQRGVRGAVGAFLDITGRKRQEGQQRFLAQASRVLAASMDYETILSSIARLVVPSLADYCLVDLLEPDGTVQRIEITHADPVREAALAEAARRLRPSPSWALHPVSRTLRTGEPTFLPELGPADLPSIAHGQQHLAYLQQLDPRSIMVVPLSAHGRTLGALTFCFADSDRRYTTDDLALAIDLAGRAALAVDNARLYRAAQAELRQRMEAETELRRWAHIFEHAGWGVLIGSADGETMEAMNPALAAMHDYEVDDLVGRSARVIMSPESQAMLAANVGLARQRGRNVYESKHVRRDGSVFPVLVDVSAVRDARGDVQYFAVNMQDLTAQQRIEEQVRQAQKMDAVGRLAGGVAHDFNNMLMIILGFADLLLESTDAEDPRHADADEIRKAAERASALTRQLLAFGRHQVVEPQVIDVNAVVGDLERMLRPLLGEGIQLHTHLTPAIGGIQADRGQLDQVIMNLALNARDAMGGGGQLTIETTNVAFAEGEAHGTLGADLPAGAYVLLAVSDTGQGMDADLRSRIFEPFFTTKSTTHHSGLGLATVYAIVKQSGGYIWVESEPGRGTTFRLCFPRLELHTGDEESGDGQRVRGGDETVLVVEDEEALRSLACRVLEDQGYAVLQASHGAEALALLDRLGADAVQLVLTDVVMPEMGGGELADRIGRLYPGLPVLYMSGYTDNDVLRRGLDDEGTRFLQKPFAPDSLVRKVREVLDARVNPV